MTRSIFMSVRETFTVPSLPVKNPQLLSIIVLHHLKIQFLPFSSPNTLSSRYPSVHPRLSCHTNRSNDHGTHYPSHPIFQVIPTIKSIFPQQSTGTTRKQISLHNNHKSLSTNIKIFNFFFLNIIIIFFFSNYLVRLIPRERWRERNVPLNNTTRWSAYWKI